MGMAIASSLREVVGDRFPVSMENVVQAVDASDRWMLKKPQGNAADQFWHSRLPDGQR